ncbi:unnamed protein product [Durusdinium trenchii]|uniref:Uncharacterized protein n=2 Tax=Durusdinium trenchii TaxID=1381693 RepID=A0ABP0Q6P4_9DINO
MDLVPAVGDWIEVRWPCQSDSADASSASIDPESADAWLWFKALIVQGGRKFLLRFEDGGEAWNSLRKLQWRSLKASSPALREREESPDETVMDQTGFVHSFEIEEEFLRFCDSLHMRREELGDKSRGDAAYGEALSGGLVSVLIRREALPEGERDVYNRLHQRCIQEVPLAWPGWIQRAAGKSGRARPSQDLRVLQYFEKANFKAHVDSGWACQALIYLNEDFQGGYTEFPNLGARYRPRRGRVLLWRSICVGFKAAVPGSLEDHPARHVACEVFGGVKRVVSLHLVLA